MWRAVPQHQRPFQRRWTRFFLSLSMMVVGPMPAFTKAMGRIGRSGAGAAVLEFGGTLDHSVFPRLERGFKVEGFK